MLFTELILQSMLISNTLKKSFLEMISSFYLFFAFWSKLYRPIIGAHKQLSSKYVGSTIVY